MNKIYFKMLPEPPAHLRIKNITSVKQYFTSVRNINKQNINYYAINMLFLISEI